MKSRIPILFALIAAVVGLAAIGVRAYAALAMPDVLDWDETYYASTTATASRGLGLYPFVQGFPQIPSMGGVGYGVYFYVLAYQTLGPYLLPLRFVSLAASVLAVFGMTMATRRLCGGAAAWAAFAIAPALLVIHGTNSIRMDSFAVAIVAWGFVLYVAIAERPPTLRRYALLGAVFALGLNFHLHTAAATVAVGTALLWPALRSIAGRQASFGRSAIPVAGFVGGYAAGALLFFALSVWPSPQSYVRTAALARLSAVDSDTALNLTAPMDAGKLAASFLSPFELIPKEMVRHRSMVLGMPWWERTLWLFGVTALLLFRPDPDRYRARPLLAGALIGAGIVLNSASPVYFAPLVPLFVPALASAVTHGASRVVRLGLAQVTVWAFGLWLVVAAAIGATLAVRFADARSHVREASAQTAPAIVEAVRQAASHDCLLAGPTGLYARYFMAYPRFVGTRQTEVLLGSNYLDVPHDLIAYWRVKQPDVVFGDPPPALASYLTDAGYLLIADKVWRRPAVSPGCTVTARQAESRRP
ncbi:MAG TPA: hypothetical protein VFV98_15370 [Vicinamibacterales bacterium]|nr:hypothetical protein [Vicinamibacterales bacterium]